MSLSDFISLCKIGEGSYSSVFKVKRISDDKIYALKKVPLPPPRSKWTIWNKRKKKTPSTKSASSLPFRTTSSLATRKHFSIPKVTSYASWWSMRMEETFRYASVDEENNRQKEKNPLLDCRKINLEND